MASKPNEEPSKQQADDDNKQTTTTDPGMVRDESSCTGLASYRPTPVVQYLPPSVEPRVGSMDTSVPPAPSLSGASALPLGRSRLEDIQEDLKKEETEDSVQQKSNEMAWLMSEEEFQAFQIELIQLADEEMKPEETAEEVSDVEDPSCA